MCCKYLFVCLLPFLLHCFLLVAFFYFVCMFFAFVCLFGGNIYWCDLVCLLPCFSCFCLLVTFFLACLFCFVFLLGFNFFIFCFWAFSWAEWTCLREWESRFPHAEQKWHLRKELLSELKMGRGNILKAGRPRHGRLSEKWREGSAGLNIMWIVKWKSTLSLVSWCKNENQKPKAVNLTYHQGGISDTHRMWHYQGI